MMSSTGSLVCVHLASITKCNFQFLKFRLILILSLCHNPDDRTPRLIPTRPYNPAQLALDPQEGWIAAVLEPFRNAKQENLMAPLTMTSGHLHQTSNFLAIFL